MDWPAAGEVEAKRKEAIEEKIWLIIFSKCRNKSCPCFCLRSRLLFKWREWSINLKRLLKTFYSIQLSSYSTFKKLLSLLNFAMRLLPSTKQRRSLCCTLSMADTKAAQRRQQNQLKTVLYRNTWHSSVLPESLPLFGSGGFFSAELTEN